MSGTLNRSIPARIAGNMQKVEYLNAAVTYATPGIATADTVLLGTIPAGARILRCTATVDTAFNAATTNVLTVGIAGTNNNIAGTADITEGSAQTQSILTGGTVTFTADTPLYVRYTQSGTAATTGAAIIVLEYINP